tara:strand:+ start:30490 stop:30693 length:204 start_codon:yes stop_codon:yes gene_type:complete
MEPVVTGLIIATVTALFAWCFKINADVHVLKERSNNQDKLLSSNIASNDKLADAISDLRVAIGKIQK